MGRCVVSELLAGTVDELLAAQARPEAVWDAALWARLADLGLTGIGVPEDAGGAGGTLEDAAVVVRACGYHAAGVPLADHAFLATWALTRAGRPVPDGPLTAAIVPALETTPTGAATGTLPAVPWARHAARVVVVVPDGDRPRVVVVDPARARLVEGKNLAGEPRDDVVLDRAPADVHDVPGTDLAAAGARGALGRAVAICGAARRVLDLTVRYAGEREQFGRPIGRFQAVQQELSELAGAVEQADAMAGQAVALAGGDPDAARAAAAAAKICAGRAARAAITTGHQVHGALGFTSEHVLHHLTRRLLAWRDEHGAEPVWAAALGETVAAGGADTLWHLLTTGGPQA